MARDDAWHEDVDRLVRALHGTPTSNPKARRTMAAGIAIIAVVIAGVVAGVVVWLTRGDGDQGDASSATTLAAATPFDPVTASLRDCPTPLPPDWADLGLSGGPSVDESWEFAVVDAFHRDAGVDEPDVIVDTRATNLNVGSMFHYPFYSLLVDGARYTPTCFSIHTGPRMIDPGGTSEALVGFAVPGEPPRSMTLEVDDAGTVYRIDLTVASDG